MSYFIYPTTLVLRILKYLTISITKLMGTISCMDPKNTVKLRTRRVLEVKYSLFLFLMSIFKRNELLISIYLCAMLSSRQRQSLYLKE